MNPGSLLFMSNKWSYLDCICFFLLPWIKSFKCSLQDPVNVNSQQECGLAQWKVTEKKDGKLKQNLILTWIAFSSKMLKLCSRKYFERRCDKSSLGVLEAFLYQWQLKHTRDYIFLITIIFIFKKMLKCW